MTGAVFGSPAMPGSRGFAMSLSHIIGVDHVLVAVRDLDAAAKSWEALGFTVSPRGVHSPLLGSANNTIMFGEDYVELLGILNATDHNRGTRDFLERREGIERVAFTTDDAAAGAAEITAKGFPADGPIHFGRPVPLPDGSETEARFNVFRWPAERAPASIKIFACQHLTREAVWVPSLLEHANGATAILRIELLADDPAAAARELSTLIDEPATQGPEGWTVRSGKGRADFLFYDAASFATRYPAAIREGSPSQGVTALVLATAKPEQAAATTHALPLDSGISAVPAAHATGTIIVFVPA